MVYTVRYSGGRGGRGHLEHELRHLGITQKNGKPNHPTTQGKVERFQATMKKWLAAQPTQPTTISQLQALLDEFTDENNHRRPHRSLPHQQTPAASYTTGPKATPTTNRDTDTHDRVRHDRVDEAGKITLRYNGRLHHIGIGRTHARTHVTALIQDRNIRIINTATGELLRELTLDPTKRYQPTGKPRTPTRKKQTG
jgi:transposase InsO family protein